MKGYLLLENGRLFEGVLRGAKKSASAELVFTTGVVGYMETLTDPCYQGQIVVQTFPCVGCYGVVTAELTQKTPSLSGLVVRQLVDTPSNFRCEGDLESWMAKNGVTCLSDVDTRALTRVLREEGVMNAAILLEKPEDIEAAAEALRQDKLLPEIDLDGDIEPATGKGLYHVALVDLGAPADIREEMEKRGCMVSKVPAGATAEAIMSLRPDGVVFTGGPGDPSDNADVAQEIKALFEAGLPMFGIGMGHQLMAMSQGCQTVKLPFGHRGGNQPVKDVKTGLTYTTTQNHGYAVDGNTLPQGVQVRFINTNDGSCEGVDYQEAPAFSVQFLPQVAGGPRDSRILYDRFIALMGGNKECR